MKKIFSVVLCFILILSLFTAHAAENYDKAKARVQFSLRKSPDEKGQKGANLKQGTTLYVLEYTDSTWCYVKGTNGRWKGYAKKDWLTIEEVENSETKSYKDSSSGAADSEPVDDKEVSSENVSEEAAAPLFASGSSASENSETLYVEPVKAGKAYDAEPSKCGISIGESETNEIIYNCYTLTKFNIRETPDDSAKKIREIKKGVTINVLAYGDDWCKVQSDENEPRIGYAKTKWLYRFHSVDRFNYEVPGWDGYRATGYITMKVPVHITDQKNKWKGNDICAGDTVAAQMKEDGTVRVILRRDWVDLDPETYEYTPFVPWRQAQKGDIIGGYTVYYGKKQGGFAYPNRIHNIIVAMKLMDNQLIKKGEEYSFLDTVGPTTSAKGYRTAGITGGQGQALGGGICHTASLTYDSALTLPFLITERRPHTDEGTSYIPLEFDATVGLYSDFRFINTLPYDVLMRAQYCKDTCSISVWYVCNESVDSETLNNWRADSILYPAD